MCWHGLPPPACTVLQEFLEAMSAYYYGDTPKLSDEEFSLLKDELLWNGSKVRLYVQEGRDQVGTRK